MRKVINYTSKDLAKKILVILFTGLTGAVGLNYFLIPANVFSAGMTGIAQIAEHLLSNAGLSIDTGILIFLLNVPVFILGFIKLGHSAMILSFANVISMSVFTTVVPVGQVTDNVLMNAITGGVLLGIGAGLSLKLGFTTGGLDIVSLLLSKTTGRTVGNYMMLLNGVIVVVAGFFFNWESALYTIITIFTMSTVVDYVHTSHQKMTAFISTGKSTEMCAALSNELLRGLTVIPARGGFSASEREVIMIVLTRYELYTLKQVVADVDPNSFTNIVATDSVVGSFLTQDEQNLLKKSQTSK
ncbi:YitT family protein [Enterococcus pseudoavium]|uniref:YitT family protein n=1 Tax=Enterococcus pseudoavium TaxID=44007 RepID=A0AAE4L2B0_9ENTE|nr:YitT family protein [Enterococcus pseudoavium]MDT2736563.1 YitT family protein [Enterococcus pseudoavium]REC31772.1 YitT family protein [Enterococcus pseudoavium]